MVFGLVSGVGVSRDWNFFPDGSMGPAAGSVEVVFWCTVEGTIFVGVIAG